MILQIIASVRCRYSPLMRFSPLKVPSQQAKTFPVIDAVLVRTALFSPCVFRPNFPQCPHQIRGSPGKSNPKTNSQTTGACVLNGFWGSNNAVTAQHSQLEQTVLIVRVIVVNRANSQSNKKMVVFQVVVDTPAPSSERLVWPAYAYMGAAEIRNMVAVRMRVAPGEVAMYLKETGGLVDMHETLGDMWTAQQVARQPGDPGWVGHPDAALELGASYVQGGGHRGRPLRSAAPGGEAATTRVST